MQKWTWHLRGFNVYLHVYFLICGNLFYRALFKVGFYFFILKFFQRSSLTAIYFLYRFYHLLFHFLFHLKLQTAITRRTFFNENNIITDTYRFYLLLRSRWLTKFIHLEVSIWNMKWNLWTLLIKISILDPIRIYGCRLVWCCNNDLLLISGISMIMNFLWRKQNLCKRKWTHLLHFTFLFIAMLLYFIINRPWPKR